MQLVRPERYGEFLSALLTLVHRGITTQLSNTAGAGEQVGRRAARPGWHAGGRAGRVAGSESAAAARATGWVPCSWRSADGPAVSSSRVLASPPCALQMVVVLDCRGASSIGLTRHLGLLKKLAVTFNQHYPVRGRSGCCGCMQCDGMRGRVGCWLHCNVDGCLLHAVLASCCMAVRGPQAVLASCCKLLKALSWRAAARKRTCMQGDAWRACPPLFSPLLSLTAAATVPPAAGPVVPPAPAGAAAAAALGAARRHAAAAASHPQVR